MKKREKGFTLVEIITVIALISILSTLLMVNIQKNKAKARDNVRIADIDKMRLAIEEYRLACGEYPEKLEPDTNNGCAYGQKLSDFLPYIPVHPGNSPLTGFYANSRISNDNDYLYSALSSTAGGKCYDYHIGTGLERSSSFLELDHDAKANTGEYKFECRNAHDDFGDGGGIDEAMKLYDFRSDSSF